mgnify:CR=1 FL=1
MMMKETTSETETRIMETRTTVNAALETNENFMTIDGVLFSVVEHRTFDDFGVTLESFKVVNFSGETRVLHSDDDALTFWEN